MSVQRNINEMSGVMFPEGSDVYKNVIEPIYKEIIKILFNIKMHRNKRDTNNETGDLFKEFIEYYGGSEQEVKESLSNKNIEDLHKSLFSVLCIDNPVKWMNRIIVLLIDYDNSNFKSKRDGVYFNTLTKFTKDKKISVSVIGINIHINNLINFHLVRYKASIAHEIRHIYTHFINHNTFIKEDDKISWRSKKYSLYDLEAKVYNFFKFITKNKNSDAYKQLQSKETYYDWEKESSGEDEQKLTYKYVIEHFYYFQEDEMNSFLEGESNYNEYVPRDIGIYESILRKMKKTSDEELKEMGLKNEKILGNMGQKVYAMKRNRDVKESDPADFSIYIRYKEKEIETWLKKIYAFRYLMKQKRMSEEKNFIIEFKYENDIYIKVEIQTNEPSAICAALTLYKVLRESQDIGYHSVDEIHKFIDFRRDNDKIRYISYIIDSNKQLRIASDAFSKYIIKKKGIPETDEQRQEIARIIQKAFDGKIIIR